MNSHDLTAPAGAGWFKSTYSTASGACVEVKFDHDTVYIRDSKNRRNTPVEPSGEPIITIAARQWPFLLGEVTGRTPAGSNDAVTITSDNGHVTMRSIRDGTALIFTAAEWQAFTRGAHEHQFNHPNTTITTT